MFFSGRMEQIMKQFFELYAELRFDVAPDFHIVLEFPATLFYYKYFFYQQHQIRFEVSIMIALMSSFEYSDPGLSPSAGEFIHIASLKIESSQDLHKPSIADLMS